MAGQGAGEELTNPADFRSHRRNREYAAKDISWRSRRPHHCRHGYRTSTDPAHSRLACCIPACLPGHSIQMAKIPERRVKFLLTAAESEISSGREVTVARPDRVVL